MECPLHCLPFQLATLSHINYRHLTNSITPLDIFVFALFVTVLEPRAAGDVCQVVQKAII